MNQVTVVRHPLVAHHLTRLRNVETRASEFRRLVQRLSLLLAYEATKNLPVQPAPVQTPLTTTTGSRLNSRIGLVPILRAGLGMVDAMLELLPDAEVWHLGLYRDEQTAKPVEYYSKLPDRAPVDVALVVDPMLATGGSATAALEALREWGVVDLRLLSIIGAPEGIRAVHEAFADVQIYLCAEDERLDERKFIVPGLGDAGDRIFKTTADH
jgi:uracil phosphoribosyltransferase